MGWRGLGTGKQRAKALTPACTIPVGPPLLSPVGVGGGVREREALSSTHGRFLFTCGEIRGGGGRNPEKKASSPCTGAPLSLSVLPSPLRTTRLCVKARMWAVGGGTPTVQTFPALFSRGQAGAFGAANRTAPVSFSDMQISSIILVRALLRCVRDPVGELKIDWLAWAVDGEYKRS